MKTRIILTIAAAITSVAIPASAQTLNVLTNGVTYSYPADMTGTMNFRAGTTVEIDGRTFAVSDVARIYVDDSVVEDNTVLVNYSDSGASVRVSGNIARYIDATVSGAAVTLTQSEGIADAGIGEINYKLTGSSSDGSVMITGAYKCTVTLDGFSLTSTAGAPVDIQNGKRIKLICTGKNALADAAGGSHKGVIVCKGHLEIGGEGALSVSGHTANGIYAKEYVELKDADVRVTAAVKDGLNCNQYFEMKSGLLEISGTGDDGIQVSYKDDADRESEDTGSIRISGGYVNVATTAVAAKGIKADGGVEISGGDIAVSVAGGGKWDADDNKTKASTCISADGDVAISGGNLNLTATGSGGKGISCDGNLTISEGNMTVRTSGGMFAYVNGTEYDNYTGNTDRLDSDMKSSPKGIKADGNVLISGGSIDVTTSGNGGEGIESKAELTVEGGTINIRAYDDAINSSGHMYIKGGDITVVASANDGLDSNGNMYISGGTIRAFGASQPECGIDANEEEGYSVIFTGGVLLAVGGGNSTPSKSESTQPYVIGSASLSAGQEVTLKNGSEVLATFTVPEGYNGSSQGGGGWPGPGGGMGGSSVLVSCPGLTSGSSYTLSASSSDSTVSARLTGGGRPGPGGRP